MNPDNEEISVKPLPRSEEEEYLEVIYPWTVQYDPTYDRPFYYNTLVNESEWELPPDIKIKIEQFYETKKAAEEKKNQRYVTEFLSPTQMEQPALEDFMKKPARKQVEESLATQYSYKQGDEEYNIWYDKYLTTNTVKDREASLTRCDPEKDLGYTKADLYHHNQTYFCLHFAKGCCCEGASCKYFHHIPNYSECCLIDQSKDIFGRSRFARHREDMKGIGSFLHETRTLRVGDFKQPTKSADPDAEMYETLWRHFSVWGEIEDLLLLAGRGEAFIRFKHRCMAEFAKEAMSNQNLDKDEIIYVKWTRDDEEPERIKESEDKMKRKESEDKEIALAEKRKKRIKQTAEELKADAPLVEVNKDQELIEEKRKVTESNVIHMQKVLEKIDSARKEDNNNKIDINEWIKKQDEWFKQKREERSQPLNKLIPPDKNNLPLI